jgi:hypothetical protein
MAPVVGSASGAGEVRLGRGKDDGADTPEESNCLDSVLVPANVGVDAGVHPATTRAKREETSAMHQQELT